MFAGMGNRVSLQIDKKGLYYILKEFEIYHHLVHGTLHSYQDSFSHSLPTNRSKFTVKMFVAWVDNFFALEKLFMDPNDSIQGRV